MRSRTFALSILLILAALLAACAPLPTVPLPSVPAPTAAPPTSAPVALPAATSDSAATATAPVTPAVSSPITPTLTVPVTPTVTVLVTPTLSLTATLATPVVTAAAPVTSTATTEKPLEAGPIPAVSTYRDDFAGFEIDYPAGWSLVDVTPQIKQESLGYSITFMSWQPQEPGGQGIPEGGSKIDVGVTKGGAESPEAAAESRRQEVTQGEFAGQITFEEPWELGGGLSGIHWTIQSARGETVHELVTATNGNRIVVSGYGDPALFEQIAVTLRPAGAQVESLGATSADATSADAASADAAPVAETEAAQAKQAAPAPAAEAGAALAGGAGGAIQPLAATVYTVRQGDTLARIAARFGVSVAAILQANPQITNPDRIYIGQRITIPTGGTLPPPAGTTRVNIYMIGMGGGSVGCGDQVVAVRRDVPRTAAPLTAALNLLLAQKSQYYGESGLYNALYQSNLRIASITRSGSAWTIRLAGTLRLGGVCDNPRVKAQLEQTALQFSTVKSVRYFINGQPLDAVLSGK